MTRQSKVIPYSVAEVVWVNKVLPSVVRRIDIDELYLAGVTLLKEFEDFEVVALDHEVLGGVPIGRVVFHGRKNFPYWFKCLGAGQIFFWPG